MKVEFKNAYCGSLGGTAGPQSTENDDETAKLKHALFCKMFLALLRKKALWFLQKLFDIPVQMFYLDTFFNRAQGHALSFVSPWIFLYRHFNDC